MGAGDSVGDGVGDSDIVSDDTLSRMDTAGVTDVGNVDEDVCGTI